jgi:hypothetical protein
VFAADLRQQVAQGAAKITDDLDVLLAFDDYPAEHWIHLGTAKPIETTFAPSGLASQSPRAPAPAPPVSRWRSSSSNNPANQRVVISQSRDTPILCPRRPPCPPPSRVPSPGYAFPQPLTRVTVVT